MLKMNTYSGHQKYSNYILTKKKCPHRLNTLAPSPDMTSREYSGDRLKEQKSTEKLALGAIRKYKTKLVHSIPNALNAVLELKVYTTKCK